MKKKTNYILSCIIYFCFSFYIVYGQEWIGSIKADLTVNVNELVNSIMEKSGNTLKIIFRPDGVTDYKPTINSRFISILAEEQVISIYCHETKGHTATAEGKTRTKPSCADPGECAYASAMRSFKDNYTYYSVENYNRYCLADSASIFNNTNDNTDNNYDFDDFNIDNGIAYDSKLDSNGIENSIHLNFLSIIVLLIVVIFLQTHCIF